LNTPTACEAHGWAAQKEVIMARSGAQDSKLAPDTLRIKYAEERDRRVAGDRAATVELEGDLAQLAEDPFGTFEPRAPITEKIDVIVIGGGFGGLLLSRELKLAGVDTFRILDFASDFGGVWYWNRYPGVMCDVESLVYMPLLEETGYIPSEKYAHGPEILEHCRRIARQNDLYRHALFQTSVANLSWSEADACWTVLTSRGDRFEARFVCIASGPIQKLKIPSIPGLETFKGQTFHTSRWNFEYTKGNSTGGLTGLRDKTVGFIGTGASGIQAIPHLGEWANKLYVFQRTPSAVAPRNNEPITADALVDREAGWQRRRIEHYTNLLSGIDTSSDLVDDGWTQTAMRFHASASAAGSDRTDLVTARERTDFEVMEKIRRRVDLFVKDRSVASSLKPYYRYSCKRPCFHDEYLETFNRPNVTLVDASADGGITGITPDGVICGGVEYKLDCLIYGTGFEVGGGTLSHQIGVEVVGRDETLAEYWKSGIRTLHGLTAPGFPNLLFTPMIRAQAPVYLNYTQGLSAFATHAAYIIQTCLSEDITSFDAEEAAESAWGKFILKTANYDFLEILRSCTPGYINNEGRFDGLTPPHINFPGTPAEYFSILREWRDKGGLAGLKIARGSTVQA
jgi:cation diffusion facilitator CzcD-associated flavoprotein CzcO